MDKRSHVPVRQNRTGYPVTKTPSAETGFLFFGVMNGYEGGPVPD